MSNIFWYLILPCVATFLFIRLGIWRYLSKYLAPISGLPDVRLEDLGNVFINQDLVKINRDPKKVIKGADTNIQVYDDRDSVIYHRTIMGDLHMAVVETINIAIGGKAGVIISLVNGEIEVLERVGGLTTNFPKLSDAQAQGVEKLLTKIRQLCLADK